MVDFDGDVAGSVADQVQAHAGAIIQRPMEQSFERGPRATFGKR